MADHARRVVEPSAIGLASLPFGGTKEVMQNDEIRRVVQASRTLLRWSARDFAAAVGVSEVTIRRIEAGVVVSPETTATVLAGLSKIGVEVLGAHRGGDAARIVLGIGLTSAAKVGPVPLASAHAGANSRQKAPRRLAAADSKGAKKR